MNDKQLAQVLALPSDAGPPYASTEEGLGELNMLLSAQETVLTRGRGHGVQQSAQVQKSLDSSTLLLGCFCTPL